MSERKRLCKALDYIFKACDLLEDGDAGLEDLMIARNALSSAAVKATRSAERSPDTTIGVTFADADTAKAIYLVTDPRDPTICYTGATASTLNERLRGLCGNAARGMTSPVSNMIRDVRAAGLKPEISLIQESSLQWPRNEQAWIDRLGEVCQGSLLNVRRGGAGPDRNLTVVAPRSRSLYSNWGPRSDEHRAALAAGQQRRRARERAQRENLV